MFRTSLVLAVHALIVSPAMATPLSELAATLAPGEFAELETENGGPVLAETMGGATGSILPYSEDAVWDARTGRYYFIGSDHIYDGDSSTPRFVAYDEADNRWLVMPEPGWFPRGTRHGYDHSAMLDGRLYHITVIRGEPLHELDPISGAWTERAALEDTGYNRFGGLEPFPALGGLVYVENTSLFLWERDADRWTTLESGLPMGDYHNFAEYNPVHEVVIFGGGNDSGVVHVLEADRSVRRAPDAPFPLRVNSAIVTVDPLSGDYLVFGGDGEFWVFDATTDEWRLQPVTVPFFGLREGAVDLMIAAPIDSYGVVMFVQHTDPGDTPEVNVWLYKHSPGMGVGRPDAGPAADAGATIDRDGGVVPGRDGGAVVRGDSGSSTPATPADGLDGGCGCSASSAPAWSALFVFVLLVVRSFRRGASSRRA
jgi:uncharacterized protein (TIGR03382 family)